MNQVNQMKKGLLVYISFSLLILGMMMACNKKEQEQENHKSDAHSKESKPPEQHDQANVNNHESHEEKSERALGLNQGKKMENG